MTSTLTQDDLNLLESGDFADVEIICQGRIWKVHQAILAGRSPWFKAALSGNWTEAKTRKINVDNVDPEQMGILIRFIYSDDLILSTYNAKLRVVPSLENHVALYIQADYFLLPRMKDQILACLRAGFSSFAVELYSSIHTKKDGQHIGTPKSPEQSSQDVQKLLYESLEDLCKAVRLAYSVRTTRELHKTVLAFILCMRKWMNPGISEDLPHDVPEFKADLHITLMAVIFDDIFKEEAMATARIMQAEVCEEQGFSHGYQKYCYRCGDTGDSLVSVFFLLPDVESSWCSSCAQMGLENLIEQWAKNLPLI